MIRQQPSRVAGTSLTIRDKLVQRLQENGILNPDILALIRSTPRHLFIEEALVYRSYEDTALPIGHKQTISQPYIVARMTELLLERASIESVLEIGTGSGYQTAILAQLFERVYTVERIQSLYTKAQKRIRGLGYRNVQFLYGDGGLGWTRNSSKKFDAIIITAAPFSVPKKLLQQLAPNGIMVTPVGLPNEQELLLIKRIGDSDRFDHQSIQPVKFVSLLSGVN